MPDTPNEEQILSILESAYSGAVYDAMRELGLDEGILPNDIQPVDPDIPLVGKVWTCSGGIVAGISQDESLLSWTGMLSAAPSGSVVVCQPNDSTIAHMGELSAETLKFRGVKGYIVDGGVVRIAPFAVLAEEEAQRRALAEEQALSGTLVVLTRTLSYARAADMVGLMTPLLSTRGTVRSMNERTR